MALADELSADPLGRGYAGMTDQQAADSLNALDRPAAIESSDIVKLLAIRNKMYAAERIRPMLLDFGQIDLADPLHLAAITNGCDWLVGLTLMAAEDKAAVLAICDNRRSRAAEIGLRTQTAHEVSVARGA